MEWDNLHAVAHAAALYNTRADVRLQRDEGVRRDAAEA
jgi:hypothetical protein